MKYFFLTALTLFVVLYLAAQGTLNRDRDPDKVYLRWMTDDNPARKLQTGGFMKMYPEMDLRIDWGLGADSTKLLVQCASGVGPDIIDCYNLDQMLTMRDAGVLLDLTPYAAEMGFGPENTYRAIGPRLMADGKQYRFPCNVAANAIVYNKALFDELGVAYPKPGWTWDEFIAKGLELRGAIEARGEHHLILAHLASEILFPDFLAGHGGRYFSEDGLTCLLDSPESVASLQLFHDLMHEHKIIRSPTEVAAMAAQGGWGSGPITLFCTNKAAMLPIGRWLIIQLPNFPEVAPHLASLEFPRLPGRSPSTTANARAAAINALSPNRDHALKFLKYLASEEYGKIIVDGGDSLPPNPKLARDGEALVNDLVPDPAFHQPFVDAIEHATPMDVSPYIDTAQVQTWTLERLQQIENQLVTPPEAAASLAREINLRIRQNLERRKDLRKRYEQATGEAYTPDWWKRWQGGA